MMKRRIATVWCERWFVVLFVFLSAFAGLLNLTASPPPGYYLVWNDEFNGTSLDPTKWWAWIGPSQGAVNTTAAITVTNGYLTITTYTTNGINYSAIISSDGLFRAEYGYYESSVEFSDSAGEWSAYWIQSPTEGQIIGNPSESGAEVDVCEHRLYDAGNASNVNSQVQTSVHWDGYSTDEKTATSGLIGSGLGTNFHTYGFLWTTTNYSFTIDGAASWSTNAGHSDRTEVIMFSQEVNTNGWAGNTPAGGYGNFLTSTTFMNVDYFRYYAPTTSLFWLGTSSANWTDTNNWLSNMTPGADDDIIFGYLSRGNFSINLPPSAAVNSVAIQESGPIVLAGGSLAVGGGGIDMISAINNAAISAPLVLSSNQNWKIGAAYTLSVTGPISGPGNLMLSGPGTVVWSGTNTCTGTTTVSNGQLYVNGVTTNAVTVIGGALGGTGLIGGPVEIAAGGTLNPGPGIGTLSISNVLTLMPGSMTSVDVNKTTGTNDQIVGMTTVNYGGLLSVNNQGGAFASGDAFKLFRAASYSGAFGRISPLTPGTNLAWDASTLAIDGTLRVVSTVATQIAAIPTGSQLAVTWPASVLGWSLQAQTNVPHGAGLSTNWITVAGSGATNRITFSVNPAIGSAFFRLAMPQTTTAVFSKGDLVVLQVGNGSIGSSGAPGYLNDYLTIGGVLQTQVALPTSGSNPLIFGGSSYEGTLSLSADGQTIVVGGYNVPLGSYSGAIDNSSTTSVPRAAGSVNAAGVFTLDATTTQFSGGTIRSAVADGAGNFWAGGGSSGIIYLGTNSAPATISTVSTATRTLNLVNGNLYFTETGSGQGVMSFGSAPKAAASPSLLINTAGIGTGTASPEGFAINTNLTIAYVADNRTAANGGGIQRFNWNGSGWVYAYTLGYTLSSSQTIYYMTADFSGANPVIYATTGESTGNKLVSVTDTGAGSAYTILETAPSGDAFRGVVIAP